MVNRPNYDQLYEIAENQAGYFTAGQARQAGFSWERLSTNVKIGKFLRIAQGVYRLVHFPGSPFEDLFVAWLRTAPNSVISHQSALAVYNLSDVLPGEVHVIIPRSASRRHVGIQLHTNRLRPDEINTREGLSVTTVARTIADVSASHLPEEQVRQAIQEAISRGLATPEELRIQAARHRGKMKLIVDQVVDTKMAA